MSKAVAHNMIPRRLQNYSLEEENLTGVLALKKHPSSKCQQKAPAKVRIQIAS
jgi:hypothetical protein